MYSIEGKLTTRRDPSSLIGEYGLLYQERDSTSEINAYAIGPKSFVEREAARLLKKGEIPEGTLVEHIASLEQAERYPLEQTKVISMAKFRRPDLRSTLEGLLVPGGEQLISGFVDFWKELRFPSPFVYFFAIGQLLDRMEYGSTNGWSHNPREEDRDGRFLVEGERTIMGVVTPVLSIARSHTTIRRFTPK